MQQTQSKVRIIEPTLNMFGKLNHMPMLIDACAYTRVSTGNEEQEMSFERQNEYYENYIKSQPNLRFTKLYSDPGITGTRAEKRHGFLEMIEDCKVGKIRKIFCKSVSRFARNTIDALSYIRLLKELPNPVSVYFESERVDTLTQGGEFLLTILASQAEQESRSISKAVTWAFQKKFEKGEIVMPVAVMGYMRDKDKKIVLDPVTAPIIQRIFREYICGKSTTAIAHDFTNEGIPTPTKKQKWRSTLVLAILKNSSYTGDSVMGKSYKIDITSKSRVANKGERRLYEIPNSHPQIISHEIFNLAQMEYEKRSNIRGDTKTGSGKFTSKHTFSNKLTCGQCGSRLRRWVQGYYKNATKRPAWVCINKQVNKVCDSHIVYESDIEKAFSEIMQNLLHGDIVTSDFFETLKDNITAELADANLNEIERLDSQILNIQESVMAWHKELTSSTITHSEYESKITGAEKDITAYRSQKTSIELKNEQVKFKKFRVEEIAKTIENLKSSDTAQNTFNTQIFNDLIETIKVTGDKHSKKHTLKFNFKCGIELVYDIK